MRLVITFASARDLRFNDLAALQDNIFASLGALETLSAVYLSMRLEADVLIQGACVDLCGPFNC